MQNTRSFLRLTIGTLVSRNACRRSPAPSAHYYFNPLVLPSTDVNTPGTMFPNSGPGVSDFAKPGL